MMKLMRKLFSCRGSHLDPITKRLGNTGPSNRPWTALVTQSQVGPSLAMVGLRRVKPAEMRMQTRRTRLGPSFSER